MKDEYYFSHASNARNDPKCAALRSKYGSQGYGWFWIIIELLRDQPNYRYPINKYTFDTFAREMQCERNAVVEFINDCCHEFTDDKSALLCIDDNYIWSESLIRRMDSVEKRREAARKAANIKWSKESCDSNANAMQTQCTPNAVKESKEKKSKVNKIKDIFMVPTPTQIQEYCTQRSNGIDAQHFFDYYSSKGWMIGKNKMKDWKAAIRTWERNNKPQQKEESLYRDLSKYDFE